MACYESVLPNVEPSTIDALLKQVPDLIVFTSSSTVSNFVKLTGGAGRDSRPSEPQPSPLLGPITAGTVESFGKQPEIRAREEYE